MMPPSDTIKELCDQARAVKDAAHLNAILSQLRAAVENQSDRLDIMFSLSGIMEPRAIGNRA